MPGRRWPLALYQKLPIFAAASELGYRTIARHRALASATTSLLWGKDARSPRYGISRRIFLQFLGLIFFIAFLSLGTQLDGLIGEHGILPAGDFFRTVRAAYGPKSYLLLPSLCWFSASSGMLHLICGGGAIASLLLACGLVPLAALFACFICYLSLTIAGQDFLSFQWDILLLETGFLALLLAPGSWRLPTKQNVSAAGLFLLKFLLAKLMFMSGMVKLTSGDPCWWNLTALDYHYWTQPLPTILAWFADKHSEWLKKSLVALCLVIEIVVPFVLWAPRRVRTVAAGLLIALQVWIAATGNYCFFNLLAIALSLLLLDDQFWLSLFGKNARPPISRAPVRVHPWANRAAIVVLVVTLPVNLWLIYSSIRPTAQQPRPLAALEEMIKPLRIANGYGLFRVMTKERPEIVVEGSADGIEWKPYEFRWKAGDVKRAPRWNTPHQPRLDWQMWFAALGGARQERWFTGFVGRLLQNEPSVTRLLASNPFRDHPPRYVRAILYRYRFSNAEDHRRTGAWWTRDELGEFFPAVSLKTQ